MSRNDAPSAQRSSSHSPTLGGILLLCILLAPKSAWGQVIPVGAVLEQSPTPRSMSMGESCVALPEGAAARWSNPASLTGCTGIEASYNYRSDDVAPTLSNSGFKSFAISIGSPLGALAVQYTRYTTGPVATDPSLQPGQTSEYLEHLLVVGGALFLVPGLSAGVEGKYFDVAIQNGSAGLHDDSSPSYLLGAGVIYDLPLFLNESEVIQHLYAGGSVQNVGTKGRLSETVGGQTMSYQTLTPEHLRLGVSYSCKVTEEHSLAPFEVKVTTEYRKVLNQDAAVSPGSDTWGFGAECTFFETLAIRGGGIISGVAGVYADANAVAPRFGAGVTLPLARLGMTVPITLRADYSIAWLAQSITYGTGSISAFSIGASTPL